MAPKAHSLPRFPRFAAAFALLAAVHLQIAAEASSSDPCVTLDQICKEVCNDEVEVRNYLYRSSLPSRGRMFASFACLIDGRMIEGSA